MAKILIVDDSATFRSVIKKCLEGENYELSEAGDGVEALTALASSIPDVLISDINMPNMDGFTLAVRVRENPATKKLPIVVISTEASPEMKTKAKEAGVTAWIVKPPQPDKLRDAIKKILQLRAEGKL